MISACSGVKCAEDAQAHVCVVMKICAIILTLVFLPFKGNYSRPPSYSGVPNTNYNGPGPGMSVNANNQLHGQGPSASMNIGRMPGNTVQSRPYPGNMANMTPMSPGMQQVAPGMGPPIPSVNRKAQEAAAAVMQAAANSAQSR